MAANITRNGSRQLVDDISDGAQSEEADDGPDPPSSSGIGSELGDPHRAFDNGSDAEGFATDHREGTDS